MIAHSNPTTPAAAQAGAITRVPWQDAYENDDLQIICLTYLTECPKQTLRHQRTQRAYMRETSETSFSTTRPGQYYFKVDATRLHEIKITTIIRPGVESCSLISLYVPILLKSMCYHCNETTIKSKVRCAVAKQRISFRLSKMSFDKDNIRVVF
jgi:hypothetical protein